MHDLAVDLDGHVDRLLRVVAKSRQFRNADRPFDGRAAFDVLRVEQIERKRQIACGVRTTIRRSALSAANNVAGSCSA